jgi:predicted metal-dependent hydrolase
LGENIISSIHIGQVKVPYSVEWSNDRETIGLNINSEQEIEVKSPVKLERDDIEETLQDKKPWILEKINRIEEESFPPKNKEFLSGEKILFKGRRYHIKVQEGNKTEIVFNGDKFHIKSKNYGNDNERRKEIAKELKKWYKDKASKELVERTKSLSDEIDSKPQTVEVIDYENKWGENRGRDIRLHWRLIMSPQEIQDYVIAHELCHLEVNNHSEMFWNQLSSIIPNHEEKREWLRKNAGKLTI